MTNADAIKWLENLKKDIGNPAYQSLWHYEQALTEIVKMLNGNDEPQTKLCRECDDYAGDGMYCASNHIVYDFSTSKGNCEPQNKELAYDDDGTLSKDEPQIDCKTCRHKDLEGCEEPCLECKTYDLYEPQIEQQTKRPWGMYIIEHPMYE